MKKVLFNMRKLPSISILTVLFVFFFGACPGNLSLASSFEIQPGLEMRYTDNAIYLYDLNSQQASYDPDLIFEPYITGKIRLGEGNTKTKISAYMSSDFYSRYSELNNQTYSFLLEQGIAEGTDISFSVHLNPFLFAGEEDINASGTAAINANYSYRLSIYTLGLDRDLGSGRHLYFFAKLGEREYNPVMAYRTGVYKTFGAELSFKPEQRRTFLIGLSGELFNADTGLSPIVTLTPSSFIDDASYISYGVAFAWIERFSEAYRLRSSYQFKLKDFTTGAPEPLHAGRVDDAHDLSITLNRKMNQTWSLKAGLEIIERLSNMDYAYYAEKIVSTGIEGRFK